MAAPRDGSTQEWQHPWRVAPQHWCHLRNGGTPSRQRPCQAACACNTLGCSPASHPPSSPGPGGGGWGCLRRGRAGPGHRAPGSRGERGTWLRKANAGLKQPRSGAFYTLCKPRGCPLPQSPPLQRDEERAERETEARESRGVAPSPLSMALGGTQAPGGCFVPPQRRLFPGVSLIHLFGTRAQGCSCHRRTTGRDAAGSATYRGLPHPGKRQLGTSRRLRRG